MGDTEYVARVVEVYRASNTSPIVVQSGDSLLLGRRDDEHPGWTWSTDPDGRSGWMHESYIERIGGAEDKGIARADYDAAELTVGVGEIVTVKRELAGWALCQDAEGNIGWLPLGSIERVRRAEG